MKTIPVSPGLSAFVDDEDYDLVSGYRWVAAKRKRKIYAQANTRLGHRGSPLVYMHHLIVQIQNGQEVDHRDGNGLNNQKENLRICTHQQNCQSVKKQSRATSSRYKGVARTNRCRFRPWRAYIKKDGKQYSLKFHATEIDAARAYDKKAVELFGEFALLNFPSGGQ